MPEKPNEFYAPKKRRMLGEVLQSAQVRNGKSRVCIEPSSKPFLLTYKSEGLVVAINGSGTVNVDHPQAQEAARFTEHVVSKGGIVLSGGRDSGIMAAVGAAAQGKSLGVIFPELKEQQGGSGAMAIVNSPTPRIELLGTCAPIIVVYRGGLGSLMVLLRAIVHVKNRQYHPDQPPQMVFVSNYWMALLTTMMNMGSLPKEFLATLHFFDRAEQIMKAIPSFR